MVNRSIRARTSTVPGNRSSVGRYSPGSDLELSADEVEHAFYVIGGTGRATSATREVELKTGGGMALPKGGGVSIHADDEPLDVFLVTLALSAPAGCSSNEWIRGC